MPNLPSNTRINRTQLFKDSGAEVLLNLGKTLIDLAQGLRTAPFRTQDIGGTVPGDVDDCEKTVVEFFDTHPRAKLRPLLTPCGNSKGVDLRVSRVVAALAASHILVGDTGVPVLTLARCCAVNGSPAEILEWRRLIAACGVNELIAVEDRAGIFASVKLREDLLVEFLGGEDCVPFIGDSVFDAVRAAQGNQAGAPRSRRSAAAGRTTDAASFVRSIPLMRPREMFDELTKRGYVGQEPARRALCLSAFRHIRRLRRVHLDGVSPLLLPNRENVLARGPTGCGKSLLAQTLFGGLLSLPWVSIDMTQFSETGYVGEEVVGIPTRLIMAANGVVSVAETGVVFADEFDKLAEAGEGRQTVSRAGVQRGLLKLMEPGVFEVPLELGSHPLRSRRVRFSTTNVLYVAAGVFSGFETRAGRSFPIGFHARAGDGGADAPTARSFTRYGIMPELYGRFGVNVLFSPLSREELRTILDKSVRLHSAEMELDGIRLRIDRDVYDILVDRALSRETGARGIHAELAEALNDAAYQAYSETGDGVAIRLHVAEGGEIRWDVSKRPAATDPLVELDEINRTIGQTAETEAG